MRWLMLALALAGASVPALAATSPEFKRAQSLYEYGDYPAAIPVLEQLVLPGRLEDEADAVNGHRMLAVSYYSVGRKQEAAREFRSLLYMDPDTKLDPFLYPPDVVEFFENVKAELADRMPELRELRERERAAKAEREKAAAAAQATAAEQAGRVRVVTRKVRTVPYPVLWLPLGIPQFLMGHWVRGAIVLVLQLLALTPSPLFFALARAQVGFTNPFGGVALKPGSPEEQRHHVFTALQYLSLLAIPVAYAVGVVDAHVFPTFEVLEKETAEERKLVGPPPKPAAAPAR